jgi:Leucine-rich repeat (LRR) protein
MSSKESSILTNSTKSKILNNKLHVSDKTLKLNKLDYLLSHHKEFFINANGNPISDEALEIMFETMKSDDIKSFLLTTPQFALKLKNPRFQKIIEDAEKKDLEKFINEHLYYNYKTLGKLELININMNKIPAFFKHLVGLHSLDLSHNNISRITNLPENLKYLNISFNNISKIGTQDGVHHPISNLPDSLVTLILYGNKIKTIENIAHLKLEDLNLGDNLIERIENLPFHTEDPMHLQNLNLSKNKIETIEKLPFVENLDLSDNRISKMENLPNNLESINLSGNGIKIIENIKDLKFLRDLYLDNNGIRRLPFTLLNSLESLVYLSLKNNPVKDFSGLRDTIVVASEDVNIIDE